MPITDENKPIGKPGQRNRKGEQRRQKSDQQQSPKPDQLQSPEPDQQPDAKEPSRALVASADASTIGAVALADIRSIGAVTPADNSSISIQTIANAYGDYTSKSLQETRSLVEKLMDVRSLDKAIEIQADFARQAYETFVAESQKICGLYSEFARQIFKPWEGLVAKLTQAAR